MWEQLHSIGRQKEASPLETLEMTLRQHFGLPVPEKWKIDSWIQGKIIFNYGGEPFSPDRLLKEVSKVKYKGIKWDRLKI